MDSSDRRNTQCWLLASYGPSRLWERGWNLETAIVHRWRLGDRERAHFCNPSLTLSPTYHPSANTISPLSRMKWNTFTQRRILCHLPFVHWCYFVAFTTLTQPDGCTKQHQTSGWERRIRCMDEPSQSNILRWVLWNCLLLVSLISNQTLWKPQSWRSSEC